MLTDDNLSDTWVLVGQPDIVGVHSTDGAVGTEKQTCGLYIS